MTSVTGPVLMPCGERAVLVELSGLSEVLAAADWIRNAVSERLDGFTDVVDVVPAATTVLAATAARPELGPIEICRHVPKTA